MALDTILSVASTSTIYHVVGRLKSGFFIAKIIAVRYKNY